MDRERLGIAVSASGLIALSIAGFALGSVAPPGHRLPRGGSSRWRNALADRTPPATVVAARRLNRAAGLLALSVLTDSAVEHYRGSFKNKAMVTPPIVATMT